jgi:hypothetical protein
MLVKYNRVNFHTIQHEGGGVTLGPGVNEVAPKEWLKVADHPLLLADIETGDIEVLDADGIADLSEAKAKALIAKTVDRDLLEKWKAGDSRAMVVKAIDTQLDKVDPTKDKATDKAKADT